jgi:hypothetical protein
MVTEESEVWPYGDISISDVVSYKFNNVFQIGGGIDFARVIPANSLATSPSDTTKGTGNVNHIIDSVINDGTVVTVVNGKGFYTFQATKVMGHFTFDPKPLFGNPSMFGSEDWKLYGEIAVIGLKNYSYFYTKLSDRMPMMLGFNIPTFKMMDCLSLECEYYSSPYLPDIQGIELSGVPMPFPPANINVTGLTIYTPSNPSGEKPYPWKWSVYAKKTLMPGITATLQLSRDHYWPNFTDGYPSNNEALTQNGQWMWYIKLTGSL